MDNDEQLMFDDLQKNQEVNQEINQEVNEPDEYEYDDEVIREKIQIIDSILEKLRYYVENSIDNIPSIPEHLSKLNPSIPIMENYIDIIKQFLQKLHLGVLKLFLNKIDYTNKGHSVFHKEPYGWHILCTAFITYNYTQTTKGFLMGFSHDIGKFACGDFTFLHGQIGVHMLSGIIEDEVIETLIDQHMCVCTHNPIDAGDISHETFHILRESLIKKDSTNEETFDTYYHALILGDRVGKICDETETDDYYSSALDIAKQIADVSIENIKENVPSMKANVICILMIGTPGTGKSTASEKLKEIYENNGYIVKIIERDRAYYERAIQSKLISDSISYEEYVIGPHYKQHYEKLQAEGLVQKQFTSEINETFESPTDIVILDTCMNLNINLVQDMLGGVAISDNTIFLGWIGFPQHQLGRGISLKLDEDKQISWPNIIRDKSGKDKDASFYRGLNEIAKDKRKNLCTKNNKPYDCRAYPIMISGMIQNIYNVSTYIRDKYIRTIYEFIHPSELTLSKFLSLPSPIDIKKYENKDIDIYRLTYEDGRQRPVKINNEYGETKVVINYRGEYLLNIKGDETMHILRRSFPIFPELRQEKTFEASHGDAYDRYNNMNDNLVVYAQPKSDGSLNVITVIKRGSIQEQALDILYNNPNLIKENNKWTRIYYEDYILAVGSKSSILLGTENAPSFLDTIITSYENLDKFTEYCIDLIRGIEFEDTISILFENIPDSTIVNEKERASLLTVKYPKASMDYLGIMSEKLILPEEKEKINGDIKDWFMGKIDEALRGENEHLEGYVLSFVNEETGVIKQIKLKFPWFYIAHKPNVYREAANKILEDDMYKFIKGKLLMQYHDAVFVKDLDKKQASLNEDLNEAVIKLIEIYKDLNDKFDIFNPSNRATKYNTISKYKTDNIGEIQPIINKINEILSSLSSKDKKYNKYEFLNITKINNLAVMLNSDLMIKYVKGERI